jgi:protein gp37
MQDSKIEWTDHTANLWWGCEEVHSGCDNCYARVFAKSKGKGDGWDGVRFATKAVWKNLLQWDREAASEGRIARVFTGSMMDIFEKPLPAVDWQGNPLGITTADLRDRYFREIIPATPNLLHLLLTKRPGNILKYVPPEWLTDWPENVMSGTSVVDQATADTLVPQIIKVPGPLFLSMEPLLGAVDFRKVPGFNRVGLDISRLWVIVGGESGHGARPMDPNWVRTIRGQCEAASVPFFFKQWGDVMSVLNEDMPEDVYQGIDAAINLSGYGGNPWFRVGKKRAGRMLDGREWSEFPVTNPIPEVA